jgi:hypothetical protein
VRGGSPDRPFGVSAMTNDEIRMTNETANPNDEAGSAAGGGVDVPSPAFRHCRFVIHSSFGFRIS